MREFLSIFFLSFILSAHLQSQTFPSEGSSLHYRLIGFSYPSQAPHISKYRLEIANGYINSEDSFKKNIICTRDSKGSRNIVEVPSFGSSYTWHAVYFDKNAGRSTSAFHHFSTRSNPAVDTSVFRFRILDTARKYKDAYVFIDDNKTLYDMSGNPVWFMPDINGISVTPRDIKLSPKGTITLLYDPPYEINYNGEVLWKGPQKGIVSGDNSEHFHHEFTRLSNGHYMVLGMDSAIWKHKIPRPENHATDHSSDNPADTSFRKMSFGTLIEYDEKGNVVWSWKSSAYFASSDLQYFIPPNEKQFIDVHENAFYFDEKNGYIYVSFKNISRIVKVRYPEGTVVSAYGETFSPGEPEKGNGMFCGQHACKRSDNGYVYLYNNNPCDPAALPKVVLLEEPHNKNEGLKKIWEYECTIEGLEEKDKARYRFISGGNVEELPDNSIFVCMSGIYSKIFIVNRDKQILWGALPERWNTTEKKWDVVSQYRASIIYDHNKLEQLIWNSLDSASGHH